MIRFLKRRKEIIASDIRGYCYYLVKLFVFLIAAVIIYQFIWKPHFKVFHNVSSSLPQHYFLVVKGQTVKKGDYICFYPPHNPLYSVKDPFLKIVGGEPGDKVKRIGREFYVNKKPMGLAHRRADNGKHLYVGPTGVIKKGEYYVYTPNPKSYDSRYASIGWIPSSRIIGRAYPLF